MSAVFSSPSFHRPLPAPYAGTHGLKLLVWVEAGFSSCREVTENPERIPRAALIGIDPVFPCRRASGERMSRGLDPTPPSGGRGGTSPSGRCGWLRCSSLHTRPGRSAVPGGRRSCSISKLSDSIEASTSSRPPSRVPKPGGERRRRRSPCSSAEGPWAERGMEERRTAGGRETGRNERCGRQKDRVCEERKKGREGYRQRRGTWTVRDRGRHGKETDRKAQRWEVQREKRRARTAVRQRRERQTETRKAKIKTK